MANENTAKKTRITNPERISKGLDKLATLATDKGFVTLEQVKAVFEREFNIVKRVEQERVTVAGIVYITCTRSGHLTPITEMVNNGNRYSISKESADAYTAEIAELKKRETAIKEGAGIVALTEELKDLSTISMDLSATTEQVNEAYGKLPAVRKKLTDAQAKVEKELAELKRPTVEEMIEAGVFKSIKPWLKADEKVEGGYKVLRKVQVPAEQPKESN